MVSLKLLKRLLAHSYLVYRNRWMCWSIIAQAWLVFDGRTEKVTCSFDEALRLLFDNDEYLIGR